MLTISSSTPFPASPLDLISHPFPPSYPSIRSTTLQPRLAQSTPPLPPSRLSFPPSFPLPTSRNLSLSYHPLSHSLSPSILHSTGQERFRSLAPAFYRSSHACVLLYSLTSPLPPSEIAPHLASWFHEFREKCPVGEVGDEESMRKFTWVAVGTKADEADARGEEGRNRAKVVQEEVEKTLEKLLPRRGLQGSPSSSSLASAEGEEGEANRSTTPKPPTMKVQVLPPPSSRRKITKPAAVDPTLSPSEPPIPSTSLAPPPRRPSSALSASSTVSSTTSIPSILEPPSPIVDLLTSTSPPSPPLHFGIAGAPPAVWVGGPFNEEELDEDLAGGGGGLIGKELDGLEDGEVEPDHRDDPSEGRAEENYVPQASNPAGKGAKTAEGIKANAELAVASNGGEGRELGVEGVEREEREEVEQEEHDYEADGIKHFRRTSAVTGEGIEDVYVPFFSPLPFSLLSVDPPLSPPATQLQLHHPPHPLSPPSCRARDGPSAGRVRAEAEEQRHSDQRA